MALLNLEELLKEVEETDCKLPLLIILQDLIMPFTYPPYS